MWERWSQPVPWFLTIALNRFPCLAWLLCPFTSWPPSWSMSHLPVLVGDLSNILTILGSSEIFFKTEVLWLKKNTIQSVVTAELPIHLFFHAFNPNLLSTYYMLLIGIGLAKKTHPSFSVTVYKNPNELSGQLRVLSTRRNRAWKRLLCFLPPFPLLLFVIMLLWGLGKLFFKKKFDFSSWVSKTNYGTSMQWNISHEKGTADTCGDVDESQKYYAAWKNPEPKDTTKYHCFYITL